MSEAQMVPIEGELIALPYGVGSQESWWVKAVARQGPIAVLTLEHLLDRHVRCRVGLRPEDWSRT